MGLEVQGMQEWQEVLSTLPDRAPNAFRAVMRKAGANIKDDWWFRWDAIRNVHGQTHIPHLLAKGRRGLGFDESDQDGVYKIVAGVPETNRQAFLAGIIEFGSQTSPPHPGGEPAIEAETPRMARYALDLAAKLLEEGA